MPVTGHDLAKQAALEWGLTRERVHDLMAGLGLDSYSESDMLSPIEEPPSIGADPNISMPAAPGAQQMSMPRPPWAPGLLPRPPVQGPQVPQPALPPPMPVPPVIPWIDPSLPYAAAPQRPELPPRPAWPVGGPVSPTGVRPPPGGLTSPAPRPMMPMPQDQSREMAEFSRRTVAPRDLHRAMGGAAPPSIDYPQRRRDVLGPGGVLDRLHRVLRGDAPDARQEDPGFERARDLQSGLTLEQKAEFATIPEYLGARAWNVPVQWGTMIGQGAAAISKGVLRTVKAQMPERWEYTVDEDGVARGEDFQLLGTPGSFVGFTLTAADRRDWDRQFERDTDDTLKRSKSMVDDAIERSGDRSLISIMYTGTLDIAGELIRLVDRLAGGQIPDEYWAEIEPTERQALIMELLEPAVGKSDDAREYLEWQLEREGGVSKKSDSARKIGVLQNEADEYYPEFGTDQAAFLGAVVESYYEGGTSGDAEEFDRGAAWEGLGTFAHENAPAVIMLGWPVLRAPGGGWRPWTKKMFGFHPWSVERARYAAPGTAEAGARSMTPRPGVVPHGGPRRAGAQLSPASGLFRVISAIDEFGSARARRLLERGREMGSAIERYFVDTTAMPDPAATKFAADVIFESGRAGDAVGGLGEVLSREMKGPEDLVVKERGTVYEEPPRGEGWIPRAGFEEGGSLNPWSRPAERPSPPTRPADIPPEAWGAMDPVQRDAALSDRGGFTFYESELGDMVAQLIDEGVEPGAAVEMARSRAAAERAEWIRESAAARGRQRADPSTVDAEWSRVEPLGLPKPEDVARPIDPTWTYGRSSAPPPAPGRTALERAAAHDLAAREHFAEGRLREARASWERAVEEQPDYKPFQEALRQLDDLAFQEPLRRAGRPAESWASARAHGPLPEFPPASGTAGRAGARVVENIAKEQEALGHARYAMGNLERRSLEGAGDQIALAERYAKSPEGTVLAGEIERGPGGEYLPLEPPGALPEVAATRAAMEARRAGEPRTETPQPVPDHMALAVREPIMIFTEHGVVTERAPYSKPEMQPRPPDPSIGYQFDRRAYNLADDGRLRRSTTVPDEAVEVAPKARPMSQAAVETIEGFLDLWGEEGVFGRRPVVRQDMYDVYQSTLESALPNQQQVSLVREATAKAYGREIAERTGRPEFAEAVRDSLLEELERAAKGNEQIGDIATSYIDSNGRPGVLRVSEVQAGVIEASPAFHNLVKGEMLKVAYMRVKRQVQQRQIQNTAVDHITDWHPENAARVNAGMGRAERASLAMSEPPQPLAEVVSMAERYKETAELPLMPRSSPRDLIVAGNERVTLAVQQAERRLGRDLTRRERFAIRKDIFPSELELRLKNTTPVDPTVMDAMGLTNNVPTGARDVQIPGARMAALDKAGQLGAAKGGYMYAPLHRSILWTLYDRGWLAEHPMAKGKGGAMARTAMGLARTAANLYKIFRVPANMSAWIGATIGNSLTGSWMRGDATVPWRAVEWVVDHYRFKAGMPTRYAREAHVAQVTAGAGLDSSFVKAELGRRQIPGKDVDLKAWAATLSGGKAMLRMFDHFDNAFKGEGGMFNYHRILDHWDLMRDGDSWTFDTAPKSKVEGIRRTEPMEGLSDMEVNGKRVSLAAKAAIFMRAAMEPMSRAYVDFANMPLGKIIMRNVPLFDMLGSAFSGWSWGTRMVPFLRQGLVGEILAGPTTRGATTSRAVMAARAADQMYHSAKMGALGGALDAQTGPESEMLRKAGSYSLGKSELLIPYTTDVPGILKMWNVDNANPINSLSMWLRLIESGRYQLMDLMGYIAADEELLLTEAPPGVSQAEYDKEDDSGKLEMLSLMKDKDIDRLDPEIREIARASLRLHRERAEGGGGGVGLIADHAFLTGGALADAYINMTSMGEKREMNLPGVAEFLVRTAAKFFIPGTWERTIKGGSEGLALYYDEQADLALMNEKLTEEEQEDLADKFAGFADSARFIAGVDTEASLSGEMPGGFGGGAGEVLATYADPKAPGTQDPALPMERLRRGLTDTLMEHLFKSPRTLNIMGSGKKMDRVFAAMKRRYLEGIAPRFTKLMDNMDKRIEKARSAGNVALVERLEARRERRADEYRDIAEQLVEEFDKRKEALIFDMRKAKLMEAGAKYWQESTNSPAELRNLMEALGLLDLSTLPSGKPGVGERDEPGARYPETLPGGALPTMGPAPYITEGGEVIRNPGVGTGAPAR